MTARIEALRNQAHDTSLVGLSINDMAALCRVRKNTEEAVKDIYSFAEKINLA